MTIWFSSDLHFNHVNIREYCPTRPGLSLEEMNEILIKNWNSRIQQDDEVYMLGDMMMGRSIYWESILNRLMGKIYLIKGNHDKKFVKQEFARDRMEWIKDYFELRVQDKNASNGKNQLIILQHFAPYVWNESHRGSWALSGHSHGSLDRWHEERLSLDVGVDGEHTNYHPISYEEIKKIMLKKSIKVVDHHDKNTNP